MEAVGTAPCVLLFNTGLNAGVNDSQSKTYAGTQDVNGVADDNAKPCRASFDPVRNQY